MQNANARENSWIFEQAELLIENSPDGVHVLSSNGNLIYANPTFYRMLGYEEGDIQLRDVSNWDLRWSKEEYEKIIHYFLQENQIFITRHRRKDGSEYDAEINVSTLWRGGQPYLYCTARDVTEKQRLNAALNESEMRFRTVFYQDRAVKFMVNPHTGEIMDANRAALEFYGYTYEELTRMKIWEINQLPPDIVEQEMQNALKLKKNYFTFKHRLASGEVRDVEVYSTALEINQQPLLFSIVHDVTERLQIEQALYESVAQHRALFCNAPIGIARSLLDGTFLDANVHYANLFGFHTPKDFLAANLNATEFFVDGNIRDDMIAQVQKQSPFHTEALFCCRDGKNFLGSITMQTVLDEEGEIQYLETFLEDVTEKRQAAIDLQTERDFAMSVVNTIGQGLTVVDVDSNFLFINPAYAQFTGYALKDLIGRKPRDITYAPDVQKLARAKMERGLGLTSTYETRLIRADGSLLDVMVTATPRWREGKVDGAIAVVTDLSKYKMMETELRNINETLQSQLKELQELQLQLQEQAIRDPLTQLYNRRYLNEILPVEIARAKRAQLSLGIMMIDIDHFKKINDTYGHKVGDETLQKLSQIIVKSLRVNDIVCRFGGEEILCVMQGVDAEAVNSRAESLRQEIAETNFVLTSPQVHITVSIGIAIMVEDNHEINDVLKRADQALYQAKNDGRNCVRVVE